MLRTASLSAVICLPGSACLANFLNFSTTSASEANFFSLPRAASQVSSRRVPSLRKTSTRTRWRKAEPLAVIAGSCCVSTFSD